MTNHCLGESAQPERIHFSTKVTTRCLVIPGSAQDCILQFPLSSPSLFAFPWDFFIPDLVYLYGYWKTQLIFTGQLSTSSFSPHSCLSTCSRLGMSKPNFPAKRLSCSFRQFQFQVDENGCLPISSSPMPRPHQYLQASFLPVKGQFNSTPSSKLSQLNPCSSPPHVFKHPPSLSLLFLAKGTKYFWVSLQIPEPDLYD